MGYCVAQARRAGGLLPVVGDETVDEDFVALQRCSM